jgi:predicted phosphohydrolase
MEEIIQKPIYYILGNHDFYGSSISEVKQQLKHINNISTYLKCCSEVESYSLTHNTVIVGHENWSDMGYRFSGDDGIRMSDWDLIQEFDSVSRNKFLETNKLMKQVNTILTPLAIQAMKHIEKGINKAVKNNKHVVILLHVPPFLELHKETSAKTTWYVSKIMGDMLLTVADRNPGVRFTILSGHSHNDATFQARPNMICHTAEATYRYPTINGVITID